MLSSAFIVRCTELLEAEGRALKRAVFRLALALGVLAVVGVLLVATLGLFAAAVYLVLADLTSPPVALVILGGVTLLLAIIGLLVAMVLRDPR